MRFSRNLAILFGVFLPVAETVRRWGTWREAPLALFDDYILAALLLYGAWLAGRTFRQGQLFLAAAWGVVCGVGYGGLTAQVERLRIGEPDPAPIPSMWVAVVKAALFVLAVIALVNTLRAKAVARPSPAAFSREAEEIPVKD